MRALWLADVLRGAGLTVVETPGWQDRGRDFPGPIEGIVEHHTASPTASTLQTNLNVVTNGNSVAPGPIAQVMWWRDGTAYIIAAGRANHAGKGGPWRDWLPVDSANARTIGFECVNNGVGEPWSPELVSALEIGTAAVLRHLGRDASRCLTHHEWAPGRKIDPAGPNYGRVPFLPGSRTNTWDGEAFRGNVARWLTPPPVEIPDPQPPAQEEDDVSIIITNAEQFFDAPPLREKYLLTESGKLRHLGGDEWAARGAKSGIPWSNAQIATAGVIS